MARLISSTITRPSDGGICFCCRRREDGVGYLERGPNVRVVFACNDHVHLIKKAKAMPQAEYDIYEKRALDAAGRKAGELLDHVYKKTDMAELTPDEWAEFLKTIIDEFGRDLARRLEDATDPPF